MTNIIWQSQTNASRIWAANTLPQVKPSGFTKFDYFFQGNDEKTYVWVQNKWEISHLQFVQPNSNGNIPIISVDSTITLQPGSNAIVENVGNENNVKLKFSIPQGQPGSGGGLPTTVGRIRYCYNETDLRNAVAGIAGNTVRKIIIAQEISITSTAGPIKLPNTAPTESNISIEFDFAGNGIFDRTTTGLPYVIGMDITDQTMAMSLANRPRTYIFHSGKMVGTKSGTGTGTLIDISCSQFSVVENMHFENAKKGVRMRFCMFGEVRNISSNDISEILIEPTRGDWPGSGNNLCSSNQFKISNVRAFVKDGMTAIIYSKACSGHKYQLVTGEGGYAQYGIYWDYNGANEVKNGPEINLCHWEGTVESQFSTAFIYIRQGGGSRTVINQTNHQLAGATRSPLIWVQGEGGGNIVEVNNLSWLIADSKFQSTGQNFWKFRECYDGGNLFTAGRWVGTVPNGISTYNNGTSEVVVKKP